VVLINQRAAERYWPGQDPIGKRISFGADKKEDGPVWLSIIGIVKDARQDDWTSALPRGLSRRAAKPRLHGFPWIAHRLPHHRPPHRRQPGRYGPRRQANHLGHRLQSAHFRSHEDEPGSR